MEYDDLAAGALRAEFGDAIEAPPADAGDSWIGVEPGTISDACRFLHDTPDLAFDFLNDLCVVDYLAVEKKHAKAVGKERLEVVYQLSSLSRRRRVTLKARLPRWKGGVAGEPPEIASVANIWRTAEWHEREAYDLMGVRFIGHPDLTRILCPDDWVGHPLRKDYQMPLEYHGIRGR